MPSTEASMMWRATRKMRVGLASIAFVAQASKTSTEDRSVEGDAQDAHQAHLVNSCSDQQFTAAQGNVGLRVSQLTRSM